MAMMKAGESEWTDNLLSDGRSFTVGFSDLDGSISSMADHPDELHTVVIKDVQIRVFEELVEESTGEGPLLFGFFEIDVS